MASKYNKIIGSNIRHERQKRKLTIEELSEFLGIAPGFLGLIERGQRGTSITNLHKAAIFFGLTLDDLITKDIAEGGVSLEVGEPYYSKKEEMQETLNAFIKTLDIAELDLVIENIKLLKKYNREKFGIDSETYDSMEL